MPSKTWDSVNGFKLRLSKGDLKLIAIRKELNIINTE